MPNITLKNRIRFARGTTAQKNSSTDTLVPGAPFYDTTTKYLYIGKDSTTPIKDYTNNDSLKVFNADNAALSVNSNISKYSIADVSKSSYESIKNDYEAGYITLPVAKQQVKQLFDNSDKRFLICDNTSKKLYMSDNASGASSDSSFPSVPYNIEYGQLVVHGTIGQYKPKRQAGQVLEIPNVIAGDLLKIEYWVQLTAAGALGPFYGYGIVPEEGSTKSVIPISSYISKGTGVVVGDQTISGSETYIVNLVLQNKYVPSTYGDTVNISNVGRVYHQVIEVGKTYVPDGATDTTTGRYAVLNGDDAKDYQGNYVYASITNIWKIVH